MARGSDGTVAEGEAEGEVDGATGSGEGNEQAGPKRITIGGFTATQEIKDALEKLAKEQDKPVGAVVAKFVADALGLPAPVPAMSRPRVYANEEEKKAAQKSKQAARNATIRKLMEQYRALEAKGLNPEEAVQQAVQSVAAEQETVPA